MEEEEDGREKNFHKEKKRYKITSGLKFFASFLSLSFWGSQIETAIAYLGGGGQLNCRAGGQVSPPSICPATAAAVRSGKQIQSCVGLLECGRRWTRKKKKIERETDGESE
jgi:hypothetical protein